MAGGDVANAVEHKDVVLALLGVAAGFAGLTLVFLGLVISTYQSFDGPTPAPVLNRYRRIAVAILIAFGIGIGCVSTATLWLMGSGDNGFLYDATIGLFGAQVVALVIASGLTAFRLLWGH